MNCINKHIIVIGGGVAGLFASVMAAHHGCKVILFEKMNRVGLKMGITGKGRCNITNAKPIREFIKMTPGKGKFLFSSYSRFSNEDLLHIFHEWGLETVTERGGRVFPASESAQDVRYLFMRKLKEYKVDVHLEEPVRHLDIYDGNVKGVNTDRGNYACDAVIICTGGKSYPRTGSTGDGYLLAKEAGHTIIPIRPVLIPFITKEDWCKKLQGLSLKNIRLTVSGGSKKMATEMGEMMFTHFGITGPIVLSLSDKVSLWISLGLSVSASLDMKPALSEEKLDKRVLRDLEKYHLKQIAGAMQDLLPHRMIDIVLDLAQIPPNYPVSELTKAQRQKLVTTLKNMPITIIGTRPIEEAIVTAGGISTKEINAKTMESKLCKNLYFAGEVIDIHAFTGGYNLQAAFSTGYSAALSILEGMDS